MIRRYGFVSLWVRWQIVTFAEAALAGAAPRDHEAPGGLVHGEEVVVGEEHRGSTAHASFLAGTTDTGPNRSRDRAMFFAGPTATTTRSSRGK